MIYKDISLNIIDNLIELMEYTDCLKQQKYLNMSGDYTDDWMGHTGMRHVPEDRSRKAMDYYNEILEPIIGYKPNAHGRYALYINPIPMHNDGQNKLGSNHINWVGPKPANTTIFFPLRIIPKEGKSSGSTSTIYFDQMDPHSDKSGKVFVNSDESFYRRHGHTTWVDGHDYSDLVNYTHKPFPTEDHRKYLTQHPIEKLFGFSFKEEAPWNIGQVAIFETARLHCSKHMDNCYRKDCFLVKTNTDLWD